MLRPPRSTCSAVSIDLRIEPERSMGTRFVKWVKKARRYLFRKK